MRRDKVFPSVWTHHISDEAGKKRFEEMVRASGDVLDRQRDIFSERLEALKGEETTSEFYDGPSVDQRLIFNRGLEAGLLYALRLISFN